MEEYRVIGEKVSSQSIPSICEKTRVTNFALYFLTLPSTSCFTLQIHIDPTTNFPIGLGTISQALFLTMKSYSSTMESTHVGSCATSSKEDGSVTIHLLIRAMYPVYQSGDCLCLRCDVVTPTFCATSSFSLSASVVRFLPCLMFGYA